MPIRFAAKSAVKDKGPTIGKTDWTDPVQVAELAWRMWEEAREARKEYETKVRYNIEFVAGNQWFGWNELRRRMERDWQRPRWMPALVFNRILMTLEDRISRLMQRDPIWTVLPEADDQGDRNTARLATQVMSYYWSEALDMPSKMMLALLWCMTTGVVYFNTFWDSRKGFPVGITRQQFGRMPEQGADEQMIAAMTQEDDNEFVRMFGEQAFGQGFVEQMSGDVDVEVIPVLDCFLWPFNIIQHDEANIWMIVKRRTVAEAAKIYGLDPEDVRNIAKPDEQDDWRTRSFGGRWGTEQAVGLYGEDRQDIIHEFQLAVPSGRMGYEKGRFAVVLGFDEQALRLEDLPTPGGVFPFVEMQEKPVPGKLYGTCTCDQMASGQLEINAAASDKALYRKRKVKPAPVVYDGSTVDPDQFSNAPGKVIRCSTPDLKPGVFEMPDIGLDHDRDMQWAIQQLSDISGTSAVNVGTAKNDNVESGRAILALQERNDQRLYTLGESLDRAMSRIGSLVLMLLQKFAVDERIVRIAGHDHRLEVARFKGEDLTFSQKGGNMDRSSVVRVSSFRNLPRTRAETYQIVGDLVKLGVLDPMKDRRRIMRILGFGDVREALDQGRLDESRAEWEQDQWKQGLMTQPPKDAEDDEIHLDVHQRWMRGEEYDEVVRKFPGIGEHISQHLMLHEIGRGRRAARDLYAAVVGDFSEWSAWAAMMAAQNPDAASAFLGAPLGAAGQFAAAQAIQNNSVDTNGTGRNNAPSGNGSRQASPLRRDDRMPT